jgi:signal transduction histidine kinase
MKSGPFAFIQTTTFRLALVYTVLFALFSAGLLTFLFQATVGAMRTEAKTRLESEFRTLAVAWNTGGPGRLEQSLLERALVRVRDFTYQFETVDGVIIVGDLPRMPIDTSGDLSEVRSVTFQVEGGVGEGDADVATIEGRVLRLGDGSVLLVGIKMDERLRLVRRVTRAVATAAPFGILLALLGGYFSARYAARRAEGLTRIAEAVMGGDLTQRADISASGDEFDRLSERLNAMLARLEQLMSTTRHAGEAIAHDLRSPLSRLRNRLEAALRTDMDEAKAREALVQTVEDVDRVLSTFNAILSLSRVNAASSNTFETLDLTELVDEMAELFAPACEDARLTFRSEIAAGLSIRGDRTLLAQAISNLLDNAVKYTPAGGEIVFGARAVADNRVEVCVRDSGAGIPVEDRARVKERFVRLDQARTLAGSGLGLALVEAVAILHKGSLDLTSADGDAPNSGLLVRLILPVSV